VAVVGFWGSCAWSLTALRVGLPHIRRRICVLPVLLVIHRAHLLWEAVPQVEIHRLINVDVACELGARATGALGD
jgi:hypothetical protein